MFVINIHNKKYPCCGINHISYPEVIEENEDGSFHATINMFMRYKDSSLFMSKEDTGYVKEISVVNDNNGAGTVFKRCVIRTLTTCYEKSFPEPQDDWIYSLKIEIDYFEHGFFEEKDTFLE